VGRKDSRLGQVRGSTLVPDTYSAAILSRLRRLAASSTTDLDAAIDELDHLGIGSAHQLGGVADMARRFLKHRLHGSAFLGGDLGGLATAAQLGERMGHLLDAVPHRIRLTAPDGLGSVNGDPVASYNRG
jgi:hypothetical protein